MSSITDPILIKELLAEQLREWVKANQMMNDPVKIKEWLDEKALIGQFNRFREINQKDDSNR